MKKIDDTWFIFARPSDRLDIMRNAHRLTGHSGHLKTAEKIK